MQDAVNEMAGQLSAVFNQIFSRMDPLCGNPSAQAQLDDAYNGDYATNNDIPLFKSFVLATTPTNPKTTNQTERRSMHTMLGHRASRLSKLPMIALKIYNTVTIKLLNFRIPKTSTTYQVPILRLKCKIKSNDGVL